jgi:16S rRNA processing protein RimM
MPAVEPQEHPQTSAPQYLLIGEILRPHGILGELRMRVLTHHPERLIQLKEIYLSKSPDAVQVTAHKLDSVRMNQQYALLKLEGVADRNQADLLRQLFVLISIQDAIPLEEGEHYLYELIGLEVCTEAGESLGVLKEVLETGANDVYIIKSPRYGEVLIPATHETILSTDVKAKKMIVRLPEGLLPSP